MVLVLYVTVVHFATYVRFASVPLQVFNVPTYAESGTDDCAHNIKNGAWRTGTEYRSAMYFYYH